MFLTRKTKINLQNRTFKKKKINLNQTIKKNKKINFTLKNKVGGSSPIINKDDLISQIIFILEVYYLKNIKNINNKYKIIYFSKLEENLKKVNEKNNEMFNILKIIIESDILKQQILDNLKLLSEKQTPINFFTQFQEICKMRGINDEDKINLIIKQKLDVVTEIALNDMINYGFINNVEKNKILVSNNDIIKSNSEKSYYVFINKKNFNIELCLKGTNSDSRLFTFGFFYDKILPESLKKNCIFT